MKSGRRDGTFVGPVSHTLSSDRGRLPGALERFGAKRESDEEGLSELLCIAPRFLETESGQRSDIDYHSGPVQFRIRPYALFHSRERPP